MENSKKITLELTKELEEALKAMLKVIPLKGIAPEAVLLELTEEGLSFSVNNTEKGLSLKYLSEGNIKQEGEGTKKYLLPKKGVQLLLTMELGAKIEITFTDTSVSVKSGKVKGKYAALDAAKYPEIPKEEEFGGETKIASEKLALIIKSLIPATDETSTAPIAKAVQYVGDGNKLDVIACDGYQLYKVTIDDYKSNFDLVVPVSSQKVLAQLLGKKGDVTITSDRNKRNACFICNNGCKLFTRQVCVSSIDADGIINGVVNAPQRVVFEGNRKELITALERSLLSAETVREAITLTINEQILEMKMVNAISDFQDEVEIKVKEGKIAANKNAISVSAALLLETLKALQDQDDEIRIIFAGSKIPLYIENEEGSFKTINMPMLIRQPQQ